MNHSIFSPCLSSFNFSLIIFILSSSCAVKLNSPNDFDFLKNKMTSSETITPKCEPSSVLTDVGAGSVDNPYLLCNENQILELSQNTQHWNKHFSLTADIDLSSMAQNSIVPIGNSTTVFSGSFNGNGFTISNYYYDNNSINNVGFFGKTKYADIRNLTLENVTIVGIDSVGAIAGDFTYSIMDNCHASGTVHGHGNFTGGLIGNGGYTVSNSSSAVNVQSTRTGALKNSVGGFIGSSSAFIYNSYATGAVTSQNEKTGGFIGSFTGIISNSYATGNVSATGSGTATGGFVGHLTGRIHASYATGNVSGAANYIGGLIGETTSTAIVTHSFANGNVNGGNSSRVSRIIGYNNGGTTTGNYSFSGSTFSNCSGNCNTDTQTTHATRAHFYVSTNAPMTEWDFTGSLTLNKVNDFWIEHSTTYPTLWFQDELSYAYAFPGAGTKEDPFLIRDIADFKMIKSNPRYIRSHLKLVSDLDFSGETYLPIADPYDGGAFLGVFNGNSHQISNISYLQPTLFYRGVFGIIAGHFTQINNLILTQPEITGDSFTGGLIGESLLGIIENIQINLMDITLTTYYGGGVIGFAYATVLKNISTSGEITGNTNYAGVIGYSEDSEISDSHSTASINGTGDELAGLIAYSINTKVKNCYTTGRIGFPSADDNLGGLIAYAANTTIENSYSTGNVNGSTGTIAAGGLVGDAIGTIISNSYSTGHVTAGTAGFRSGGLVGSLSGTDSQIKNSYATGNVTGRYDIGGLVGRLLTPAVALNSYATGNVTSLANNNVGGLIGSSTGTVLFSFSTGNVNGNNNQYISRIIGNNTGTSTGNFTFSGSTFSNCAGNCNTDTQGSHAALANFYLSTNAPMSTGTWDFSTIWVEQTGTFPKLRP